ncbi:hypothetical protein PGT21_013249 [Puccinia graminis f. sp. tritici]|uniref:CxC1-like cysteine cluster associated with KDZ transposases domain-containing protein n=1 Tax=Puccinia graminis f. sp. tritici TaxID=56615 RepID=A0A5B0LY53_PUCGR|nr:hypothetical protein PGTUg99_037108 [Puccinia graminis f. sp. tritici]KAA1104165.1 hypothetical protein PGT21_013249 [Puccinia graminis f. sp. tritici]
MPLFEGDGGKRRKRIRKPKTKAGLSFSQAVQLEHQHILQTPLAQTSTNHPNEDSSGQEGNNQTFDPTGQDNFDFGADHIGNNSLDPFESAHQQDQLPSDHQDNDHLTNSCVQQLHRYFQSEHYKQKKILEEKNWEEAYQEMFSLFQQCAIKTFEWGNPNLWNRDWNKPCNCIDPQSRPVVLVDMYSKFSSIA